MGELQSLNWWWVQIEVCKVRIGGGYRWRCERSGLVVVAKPVLMVDTGRKSGLVVNIDEVGIMSGLKVDTDGGGTRPVM